MSKIILFLALSAFLFASCKAPLGCQATGTTMTGYTGQPYKHKAMAHRKSY